MRVLVTGNAGFIGHHVSLMLHREGHEVMGVDSVNDYYLVSLKEARLAEQQKQGVTRFRKMNLANLSELEEVFKEFQPELVLNLAAQAGVRYSITNPHAYIESNITAFMNILECCRHFGKPRLVYASSSSVYGGNKKTPFSEADRVDNPISLYAATKKSNELMAHTYTHLYDLQTVGLRFFTVYGPWGRPDMAMWLFCDAIINDRPIKVFNHGDMERDFTYIDDIRNGIFGALFSDGLQPYEVFNLGNHRSERLMDMIGGIEKAMGKTAKKDMYPMQDGDVKATFADTDHAHAKLNFRSSTNIAEGIPKFVEWFMAHPEFHSKS